MSLTLRARARRSHLFWQIVFVVAVLVSLYVVIQRLSMVLTPVVVALILSYWLDPVVSWMERRMRFPRWAGTLALFFVALLALFALLILLVPVIVRELGVFKDAVPAYVTRISATVIPWVERTFGVRVPTTLSELTSELGDDLRAIASEAAAPLSGMAESVADRVSGTIAWVGATVLIPIFTLYFLPKFPGIVRGVEELIPLRYVGWVRETAREIDRVLSAWIRGQLTVVAILTILYCVGLAFVAKIKMAVLIGLISGVLAFIPYVGVAIGLSLSLLVCLLEYNGPGHLLLVVAVFGTVQLLDGFFITPNVVGDRTGLGPVGVLIALALGWTLFGFVGVLIAVPTAAAVVVVLKRAVTAYRKSGFYTLRDGETREDTR